MGRFTSVQTFSDLNTKVVSGYTGSGPDTGKVGGSGGGGGEKKVRVRAEVVTNIQGSTAGAGSGEFDLYRAARRREQVRLETLATKERSEVEAEIFALQKNKNKREAEDRTDKNRAKRLKKKEKSSQWKVAEELKALRSKAVSEIVVDVALVEESSVDNKK